MDVRKRDSKRNDRHNEDFPLRGTAKCACGTYLTANWSRGRSARYAYYHCLRCARVNIPRAQVEDAFCGLLDTFRPVESRLTDLHGILREKALERMDKARARAEQIETGLEEIRELSLSLGLKSAKGIVPDDVAAQQFGEWERQKARLEAERAELGDPALEIERLLAFAARFLSGLAAHWRDSSLANKKRLQNLFFPSGLVYEGFGSFRTADYPLLEQTKGVVRDSDFDLVVRTVESPNHEIWTFLSELYVCFGSDASADDEP